MFLCILIVSWLFACIIELVHYEYYHFLMWCAMSSILSFLYICLNTLVSHCILELFYWALCLVPLGYFPHLQSLERKEKVFHAGIKCTQWGNTRKFTNWKSQLAVNCTDASNHGLLMNWVSIPVYWKGVEATVMSWVCFWVCIVWHRKILIDMFLSWMLPSFSSGEVGFF